MRGLLTVVFCLATAITAAAQSARAPEYEVKAAFLYNFAKFVQWPAHTFAGSTTPIRLCVLGSDPFGGALDTIVRGKTVEGRPIVHSHVSSSTEARGCHLLFISGSDSALHRQTLAALGDSPVLTVGESDDFLELGGMINFVLEEDRVRFEINLRAAESHRLKLSSKLLAVARVVKSGGR